MKKNLLTSAQKRWLKKYFKNNNIHVKISNLERLVYLLKTGCQWRLLPDYYGAWQTVYWQIFTTQKFLPHSFQKQKSIFPILKL
ncbi:MAG: transposase [Muribaculaceae bacterium]